MVERILAPVRARPRVCAAFYGHPGVFVTPAHEAIRRARAEGHRRDASRNLGRGLSRRRARLRSRATAAARASRRPISCVRQRRFDPTSHLLLWQIGALGVADFRERRLWNETALAVLAGELAADYGERHEVEIYEARPVSDLSAPPPPLPRSTRSPEAPVTLASTLYVPPLPDRDERRGDARGARNAARRRRADAIRRPRPAARSR